MLRAVQRVGQLALTSGLRHAAGPALQLKLPSVCQLHAGWQRQLSFSPVLWRKKIDVQTLEDVSADAIELDSTTSTSVILRPYQSEAIEACLTALDQGKSRLGVSSPTGSGKTTMFMHLIPRVPAPTGLECQDETQTTDNDVDDTHAEATQTGRKQGQVLILVGSVELAAQTERAAQRILGPDYTVEVEQAARVATGYADVTVATYQTLRDPVRLRKFDPRRFKLVIVDEAHHAAAISYVRLLHYFNDQVELPQLTGPISSFDHGHRVPIVGFSATFSRHDALALSAVFEEIVFHRDVGYMLGEGWLCPVQATSVYADLHLDEVELTDAGDYKSSSLAHNVNNPSVNELIIRTYLHRASDRRATLVFAVDLAHVAALVDAFRAAGIDARSISSITPPKERRRTVESFQAGEFPVLVNCEVLTEGTDIPQIDCVILARPSKSKNLLAQMVGRGLRLSPETNKDDCYVIDIADNISRASSLAVAPTLFGMSYDDGHNASETEPSKPGDASSPKQQPSKFSVDKVTMVDTTDPFGLDNTKKTVWNEVTPNAWVACGNNRYILEMIQLGFITVQPFNEKSWSVSFTQKLPRELVTRSPYSKVQQVAYADTLTRAIETADRFAERRLGIDRYKMLSRHTFWRSKPASEKQLAFLLRIKGVKPGAEDGAKERKINILGKSVPLSKLTSGMVASYIVAIQHGANKAIDKLEKAARRQAKEQAKKREKEEIHAARNLRLPDL